MDALKWHGVPSLNVDGELDEDAVDDWSMRAWGQAPSDIFHWSSIDQRHEVLLRYPNMVAVVRMLENDSNEYSTERQVIIRIGEWNPGAVQANRLSDGTIKVRFRRQGITLSAMMKTPHALSSLLEEWLMGMRGEPDRERDQLKRIQAIKRHKDAITRMLDQAKLEKLVEAHQEIESRVHDAESNLGTQQQDTASSSTL